MPKRTNTRTGEKRRITRREKEVLRLIAQGYSSQKVADALCISKRTVDFHIANIYGKLDLQNRVQAFCAAAKLGLIPVDQALKS
jgi:DNA-binding CsgD family transcriptional regulator